MLKKLGFYSLALALVSLFTLAYSQQQNSQQSSTETLTRKQRAESANKDRLSQFMSQIGVQVGEIVDAASISAYRQLNITLSTRDKPDLSPATEQLRSTEANVSLRSSTIKEGSLPRRRSFQLTSDQLLIITVDNQSRLRWWFTIPDPRILRAEGPGPDGVLTGEVIFQKSVNFTLHIPNDSAAVELRMYHPRWTGQEFIPVLISSMPLNK